MYTTITRFLLLKNSRRSLIIRTYVESTSPQIRPVFEAIKIKSPSRPKLTKIKKPPFAKSLFAGEIDPDVMTYPEVLDEDTLKALNERLLTLEDFFAKQVDSAAIDSAGCIPPDILEGLKQLDLFGQQIPVEYGGLGLTVTEFARLSEALASDPSIFLLLAAHQLLGLQGLLIAGTEEQKYRYLPRLANGDWVAALCLSESESGSDLTSIKTQATLSEDGDTWVINGSKNWVTNGNIANLYIVFAKTKMEDHKGQIHDRTTAFLVEREFEGVSCGQPDDKLGVRGTSTCEVFFKETPVPVENVLGEVNKGFNLALDILNGSRYGMGGLLTEVLKKFIGWATEHVVNRNQLGKPLKDFELIQEKLAKVTSNTYAVESMTYLLAAMLDTYEDPDCTMEAAMLKVFGTETCWNGINDCLQLLGGKGYLKNYPYERLLRDMRITMLVDGANDALRFFIAFKGLQHVGPLLNERVKGMRNPLNNPGLVFKTLWKRRNQDKDDPSLNLGLCNNLHPALEVTWLTIISHLVQSFKENPIF